MSFPFLAPGTECACTEPVPDGAVRLDALHNLSMAEGNPVWHYEPGHPMVVVFTTTVDPGDLADMTLCEQVFMLLDIGHDPADVERPEEPDPRALAYRERGNRGPLPDYSQASSYLEHNDSVAVAELVLRYLQTLAWPFVAVGMGFLFRKQLSALFGRMTRVETPAGTINFEVEARLTQIEVEAGSDQPVPDHVRHFTVSGEEMLRQARQMVEVSPDGAVLLAWRVVELAYRRALSGGKAWSGTPYVPPQQAIEPLVKRGLSPSVGNAMVRLSKLRNQVAHEPEAVSADGASEFIKSCEAILLRLDALVSLNPPPIPQRPSLTELISTEDVDAW